MFVIFRKKAHIQKQQIQYFRKQNKKMELDTKNLFNFKYLIKCTLDGKITWETLTFFLNDLTPTLPKAKELLKIMLKEFEAFHKKIYRESNEKGEETRRWRIRPKR